MRIEGAKIVGIVGLGLIGIALARRLLAAGYEVHGYDLDPQRKHCDPPCGTSVRQSGFRQSATS